MTGNGQKTFCGTESQFSDQIRGLTTTQEGFHYVFATHKFFCLFVLTRVG